jgi:hypothetical protein
LQVQLE